MAQKKKVEKLGDKKAGKARGGRKKRILIRLIVVVVLLVGVGGIVGVVGLYYLASTLPDLESLDIPVVAESTKIYDRTGEKLLYEISGPEKRTSVPLKEIPNYVQKATLAIEDASFYSHGGISSISLVRVIVLNIFQGKRFGSGGSTITQQLAKNTFLTPERTFKRKLKEFILAWRLEQKFTKDEILELYLNQIPYGSNIYGIEAASQGYFKKSVQDISLAEAALLASLPKAPTYYSPWGTHVEELKERKNLVLSKMHESGFISENEKRSAQTTTLGFAKPTNNITAPHFVITVQEQLIDKYGEDTVRNGGLRVITTLDTELQELAERVVKEGAERNEELYEGKNASLVALDPKTGQVLALVGSRNYFDDEIDGNFNVATQGLRQPGSAFKPITYLEAFRRGYQPETVVFDVKTEFDTTNNPEKSYSPENFDLIFRGPVTLRNALAQSINVPAVKTLYLAGLDNVLATAKKLGITTLGERSRFGLSLVLGGGEVTLLDLVGAYGALAQDGKKEPTTFILEVKSRGEILEQYKSQGEQIIEQEPVRMVNNILSDIDARRGLFSGSLNLTTFPGYEVALKTGTTNDYRDAWTLGYTPSLVVGVWAGNNDNTPLQKRGSSILAAVPMWNAFMKEVITKLPQDEFFEKPKQVFSDKPMLKGEHIVVYEDKEGNKFPQLHNILFYIDKTNPDNPEPLSRFTDNQFQNWESAVLAWGRNNIANFNEFNQAIPANSTIANAGIIISNQNTSVFEITWKTPSQGAFVGSSFSIEVEISSSEELENVSLFINNVRVESRENINSKNYIYQTTISSNNVGLQNELKIQARNKTNEVIEKGVIIFQKSIKQ
ncbi:MAG: penicillin-binding protein [Candidatus Harrisonbacteria bacterium CG10_big_fil_rev_8_21_14_0_10_42_17]|uniref:Penicillin-binding protein n=1 Tax=Candidatus Harrisonbacteria bacterium CG10_big_fil_rev_8_21_14_0_10_42_17 TaxID=1974584 RepID=A0A2M6WIU9_9BACT|nr:MAG: penicillin-binding protein [Candidatus Harrisonbacteria bacterium CG10_big_fil_rev_8_21_14_0_10_42_17]